MAFRNGGEPFLRLTSGDDNGPRVLRYGLAFLLYAIAAILTFTVPAIHSSSPFFPFLAVVAISAWFSGTAPALFVALISSCTLSVLLTKYFSAMPQGIDVFRLCLFFVVSLMIALLSQRRRRASESFRTLVESAPDAIIGVDEAGSIVLVNSQAATLFGYQRNELLGQRLDLLVPERFRHAHSAYEQDYRARPRTRAMAGTDLQARRKDGTEFPAEISLSPIRTDRGLLVTSIIRDITERKKAEEARAQLIREQMARAEAETVQKRFRDLVQDLDAIVWEADIETKGFTFVSERARQILGYAPQTWTSDPRFWLRHVNVEDRKLVVTFFRHLGSGGPNSIEYRAQSATGTVVWLRLIVYVVRDQKGLPVCLRGLMLDVTARKVTEEALRTTEKLAATGRLAASIAHEINNPMAAVTNLLYLIEHHPNLDDGARRYAKLAQDEIHRVAHITRQMLGFYRDSVAAVRVSVPDVITTILELYKRRLEDENVTVTTDIRPVAEVHAFPGELRQVFSNLLLNAVEAVGTGGKIHVRISPAHEWKSGQNEGVRVTFADNGTGIQRENIQRVFEPFFTTKGQNGTGLGLWVSHGIVQKHGGSIHVRSSVGPWHRGTTFSVFLPLSWAQEQTRHAVA